MYAYFKLIKHTPEEWEIDLINQLDNVFLEVHNKQQESQQKKKWHRIRCFPDPAFLAGVLFYLYLLNKWLYIK